MTTIIRGFRQRAEYTIPYAFNDIKIKDNVFILNVVWF